MRYSVMLEIELEETKEDDVAGVIADALEKISDDYDLISCEHIKD